MIEPAVLLRGLQRDLADHKGRFGHVLVLGGSTGFAGAACLAARAAVLGGAGLVTLGVPESLLAIVACKLTACMTRPFRQVPQGAFALGALPAILAFAERATVVALGPGIGRHRSTGKLVHALVRRIEQPLVIDADALNALEGATDILDDASGPRVLTPHPGEMARLTGLPTRAIQEAREQVAAQFAAAHKVVVALKGHATVVTDGGEVFVNSTGNPGMATGGTGDVLTGLVAALIAQGLESFRATALAVHLHGLAGDLAAAETGQHALDVVRLLDHLPAAFRATMQA